MKNVREKLRTGRSNKKLFVQPIVGQCMNDLLQITAHYWACAYYSRPRGQLD